MVTDRDGAKGGIALVTGGTGFVGGHLARRLVEAGRPVRILSRVPGSEAEGMERRIGELRSKSGLREAVQGASTVFHAAALVPGRGSDREMFDTNVEGTRNLVEACLESGVERLVHISSVSAYLNPVPGGVLESSPLGGEDAYGRSKAGAERMVREACAGKIKHIILRPCQVYGPLDSTGFTGRMLRLLSLPILPLPSGISPTYGLVHIEDLTRAILLAEPKAALQAEAYNIAAVSVSLMEMAQCARGVRPIGIPVPDAAIRAALYFRWKAKQLLRGGSRDDRRSYRRGKTHGSIILGGPAYDGANALRDLGFRPEKPHYQALRELWDARLRDITASGFPGP